MTLLFLNWKDIKHPEVGGAEIILFELAKRLVADGHQVTWFSRRFQKSKSREQYQGIDIIRKGNILTMYLQAPLFYWRLPKKPEVVIDASNTIYWQSPLWAYKSKVVAYLNQLAQEVFDYEYPPVISWIGKTLEKTQYLTYKKTPFLCYSKNTKKDLTLMGIPKKNIWTFSLGLDHSRYAPRKKTIQPLFLCVNRLVKMKRTDLAIKAFKIVSRKYPKAKLAIVGYGYERKRLEELRNKMNLQKNVFFQDENILFFKKTAKDNKIKLMQKAWALIFPSVKEGWGMTVTECAACGTPTIATDVTGLRDAVVKNKTGLLASSNPSPDELASLIIKLIEKKALREKLAQNALTRANDLSWEKSYQEFKKELGKTI